MIVDPTTARNQKDDSQKPEARPQRAVGAASEDHPEALGCGLDEMPSAVSVVASRMVRSADVFRPQHLVASGRSTTIPCPMSGETDDWCTCPLRRGHCNRVRGAGRQRNTRGVPHRGGVDHTTRLARIGANSSEIRDGAVKSSLRARSPVPAGTVFACSSNQMCTRMVAVGKSGAYSYGKPGTGSPEIVEKAQIRYRLQTWMLAARISRRPAKQGTSETGRPRHCSRTYTACPQDARLWIGLWTEMWKTWIGINGNRQKGPDPGVTLVMDGPPLSRPSNGTVNWREPRSARHVRNRPLRTPAEDPELAHWC